MSTESFRALDLTVAAVIGILAVSSARAAELDVKPPAGFAAKQTPPEAGNAVTYEVSSTTDGDAGCLVGFAPAAASRGLDQGQINAAAGKPGYLDTVKASVSSLYDVDQVEPFSMQGAQGVAIVGSPKAAKGAVRSLMVLIETPHGRLNVSCVGDTGKFAGLRPGFEGVVRGVTLPR